LALGPGFVSLSQEYRTQYHPQINLFECTNRNLEYVLRDLGMLAGVETPISFETLRMTCAVRDYRRGVPLEALRLKLGLSRLSWEDTSVKIERLAASPL
jgi:integrase/recombinase XerD